VFGCEPGAGATTVALGLAHALALQGERVLLVDEDLSHARATRLAGASPPGTLAQVLAGAVAVDAAVGRREPGMPALLPGDASAWGPLQALHDFRTVVSDARLGADGALSRFSAAAHNLVVVMRPERESLTAAYACIKRLHHRYACRHFELVVNGAASEASAMAIAKAIEPSEDGSYPCPTCQQGLASLELMAQHLRHCTGGKWQCDWCACKEIDTPSKANGPNGAKSLCNACGSRFRAGHTSMPIKDEEGKFVCPDCKRPFDTIGALGGHRRFCEHGSWRCGWCEVKADVAAGKGPGPKGPKTLCCACSGRFKEGQTGPPEPNEHGLYVCERCEKGFDKLAALGAHRRFCDGERGAWRCGWCDCTLEDCAGKTGGGPDGAKTLCHACSVRFKKHGAAAAAPVTNAEGKFVCESCTRQFDTIGALGGHRRFCDKGEWRCQWCECRVDQCAGKGPGPEGPKTLCSACSARFRAGHTAAPLRDEQGNFLCDSCQRSFGSMGALGGHRRFCQQLSAAAVPRKPDLVDDALVEDCDVGAAQVAVPDRPASRLPPPTVAGALAAYDFIRYFYTAIVPKATLLEVKGDELIEDYSTMSIDPKGFANQVCLWCRACVRRQTDPNE
jgi:hypothetical protein